MRLAFVLAVMVIGLKPGSAADEGTARRDMQAAAVTLSMAHMYSGKIVVTSTDDAHFADNSVRFHRDGVCRIRLYGTNLQGHRFSEVWNFEDLTGRYYVQQAPSGVNLIFEGDQPNVRCFEIPSSASTCVGSALVPSIGTADIPIIVEQVRRIITDCRNPSG